MTEKRASTSRRSGSSAKARKPAAAKRAAASSKAPVKKKAPARAVRSASPKPAPSKAARAKGAPAKAASAKRPKVVEPANDVVSVVERALDDMKAVQVKVLDVRKLTDIADTLIIASGTSDRHVRSIADKVVENSKKAGFRPMGVEGQRDGEWVLVDLQDVIVHVMLPRVRELYRLESLWDVSAARRDAVVGE